MQYNSQYNHDPNAQYLYYTNPNGYKPRKTHTALIVTIILLGVLLGVGVMFGGPVAMNHVRYNAAVRAAQNGNFDSAVFQFAALGDFKDSREKISETKYNQALAFADEEKYDKAAEIFLNIEEYSNAHEKAEEYMAKYVMVLLKDGNLKEAKSYMNAIGNIDGTDNLEKAYNYYQALDYYNNGEYEYAANVFQELGSYLEAEKYFAMSLHQIYVMMGYGNVNPEYLTEAFQLLEVYKSEPAINKMMKHPIYLMAKIIGEWKTEDGYWLKFWKQDDGYYLDFNFPVGGSKGGSLKFNGNDICSVNLTTGESKTFITVKSFSPDDSIHPDTMVIVSAYNNREYIFSRKK